MPVRIRPSFQPSDYNHFEKAILEGAIHCEAHHRHSYDPKMWNPRHLLERDERDKFAVLENDWTLDREKRRLMGKRLERIRKMTRRRGRRGAKERGGRVADDEAR